MALATQPTTNSASLVTDEPSAVSWAAVIAGGVAAVALTLHASIAGKKRLIRPACVKACSRPEQLPATSWLPPFSEVPFQAFRPADARGSFSAPP